VIVILRVSEIRVLRGIFRSQKEEVAEDWRRLHTEELHYLNASKILLG
jgi:predicted Holliday junction resolvase-like endonuclease